ncbi:MAG: glycoside hydrolase family 38 C-terminal domain-containing protein [Terrimicrobiaceae bacterium]
MLPSHHLPQLILNRIDGAVRRLREEIWENITPARVSATPFGPEQRGIDEARCLPLEMVAPCSFWGRLFDQRWYRVEADKAADPLWLNWRSQSEDTLYVKGEPWFGFDVGHRHVRLPEEAGEIWVESNCIQSAIWHPEAAAMDAAGSYFEGAFFCRRNEEAWQAYHDLKCLFDLAADQRGREDGRLSPGVVPFGLQAPMERFTPTLRILLRIMNEAVDAWDATGTLEALRSRLAEGYRELRMDKRFMRCVLTGHAHIDLVWLWPERLGELKAVHTFSTVNRLMEDYPEFRFAYSQVASYEAVRRRAPGLYEQVSKRMRSGQWQATGAMYVESDTILACGEALARSFLLGQKGFTEINGRPATLTWLPDAFGYSACLPQIMAQTGVKYFYTTKVTWNSINPFPYSSFVWRSNGSEVIGHITRDAGYNTFVQVPEIRACVLGHQQGDIHRECLLPTGFGDGGGGPTDEICERARRLGSLPGMPELAWDHPEAFFDRLEPLRDRLPVHQGECYLEFHRGTYTTHGNLKEAFRGLERALHSAEAVAAATGKRWDMEPVWKRLVFAQFHDYIPGSSVWDVYLEGIPELEALAGEQLQQARAALEGSGRDCIFNPHPVGVKRWVGLPDAGRKVWMTIPPLAGAEILEENAPEPVRTEGRTVSNGLAEFRITGEGWIDRLVWEGMEVPIAAPLGQLVAYPDRAANFEAWDIDRHVLSLGKPCVEKAEIEAWSPDPRRAGFRVRRRIGRASEASVVFFLEAGSPLLHIEVTLDWREPETLLKIVFPTEYAAANARFGAPFGSTLRSQVPDGLIAEAMWEVPFSRHFSLFDEGEREGLFVVSEAKYGVSVRSGVAGVSLVRSPRVTGLDGSHRSVWPEHLTRLERPGSYSDIGAHHIRLAMGRYDITLPREAQPAAVAETLFTDPIPYRGEPIPSALGTIEGGETLVPCWAAPLPEGKWVLRLHEVAGRRGTIRLAPPPGWTLQKTDLGMRFLENLDEDNTLRFEPYQVASVLFSPISNTNQHP